MGQTLFHPEEINEYVEKGYWRKELTSDFCDQNALDYPNEEALVDSNQRLTWSQVKLQMDRIALGLIDTGIGKGQVLIVQLYNSVELFLIRLACEKAGILIAPIPISSRFNEVKSIIKQTGAQGVIIPWKFRKFDYLNMVTEIRHCGQPVNYIFVTGEHVPQHAISIQEMVKNPLEKKYAPDYLEKRKFSAFECSAIRPTGGTTGKPKLVAESSCARLFTGRIYIKRTGLKRGEAIGVLGRLAGGAGDPLAYRGAPQVGAKVVLLEHFTAESACRLIEKEKLTAVGLVPTILSRLLSYPDLNKHDFSSLRFILSSTSLLPFKVAQEGEMKFGVPVISGYGSTDAASIALSSVYQSRETRLTTVGRPLDGNELRLIDDNGQIVNGGEIGEITLKGPHRTGVFYNDPELTKESWQDGWFHVGDLGKFDRENNLILSGRKSDIIIRGGQNIYPKEVEDLLLMHHKVLMAAIVRMPCPDMGERACACVVLHPGHHFSFEEMVAFLENKKIAKYKLPERLEIVHGLPMTSAEKVNKKIIEQDIILKLNQKL